MDVYLTFSLATSIKFIIVITIVLFKQVRQGKSKV